MHASWREVRAHFQSAEVQNLTTCRESVAAFRATSARYLSPLLRHLASWTPRSSALEGALSDVAI
ncbi:MAG TPA: hypothetical protein VFZ25_20625 [Chloroflexota bacterium]|nr:hypothetical protein [Chloroflexota bacterium]